MCCKCLLLKVLERCWFTILKFNFKKISDAMSQTKLYFKIAVAPAVAVLENVLTLAVGSFYSIQIFPPSEFVYS